MKANAWKYGWVMSYPKGSKATSCYDYEPWHYRYVGRKEASAIHASGLTLREWLWTDGGAPAPAASVALTSIKTVRLTLSFAAGTYTGYHFSSTGAVTGSKGYRLTRSSSAPVTKSAVRLGKTYYYASAGVWAGYWLAASTSIKTAAR